MSSTISLLGEGCHAGYAPSVVTFMPAIEKPASRVSTQYWRMESALERTRTLKKALPSPISMIAKLLDVSTMRGRWGMKRNTPLWQERMALTKLSCTASGTMAAGRATSFTSRVRLGSMRPYSSVKSVSHSPSTTSRNSATFSLGRVSTA